MRSSNEMNKVRHEQKKHLVDTLSEYLERTNGTNETDEVTENEYD